jgi:hypothetical protein
MGKTIKAAILQPLSSRPPIPLRLAPRRRALRVLRLHPVGRTAAAIARVRVPRHEALKARGAGLREQRRAVAGDSVVATEPPRLIGRLESAALMSDAAEAISHMAPIPWLVVL